MKNITKVPAIIFIMVLLAAILPLNADASVGYTATPMFPENQRASTSGYFDLHMQPGQRQELAIVVANASDEEITVSVEAFASTTDRVGTISYVPRENLVHTPRFMIPDLVEFTQKQFDIPPNSQQDVMFTLTMPDEKFDGEILGGINIIKELSEAEKSEATGGFIQQYAYTLAVNMRQSDNTVEPDFYVQDIHSDLVHHRATVVTNIVNPQMMIIRDAKINVEIFPEDDNAPVMEFTSDSIRLAPDSVMPLTLSEELGGGISSGNYVARINLQYEGKQWDFEEAFTITPEEAQQINEVATSFSEDAEGAAFPVWAILAIAAGGLLLIVAIVLIIVKAAAKRKEYEQANTKLQLQILEMQQRQGETNALLKQNPDENN